MGHTLFEAWLICCEVFFLMCGFRDPHAPWAAPQRMWDL